MPRGFEGSGRYAGAADGRRGGVGGVEEGDSSVRAGVELIRWLGPWVNDAREVRERGGQRFDLVLSIHDALVGLERD